MRSIAATATRAPTIPGRERSVPETLRSLLPYLWQRGDWVSHARIVVAVVFMLAAKVATVLVPLVYSRAVDALAPKHGSASAVAVPLFLIVGYGLLRVASSGFGEVRDMVFAAVQQRVVRRVAFQTFQHVHKLSLRYHLDRKTGGLARAMERGTNGIEAVLRLAVFNVVPTLVEVALVSTVLWRVFDWRFAVLTIMAVGTYLSFTVFFSQWRIKFRRVMNETDSEAQTKAVDSLLNYETVKYFGNEAHEARRFDESLARYERAAVRSQVTLNLLNLGQATIIAAGLALMMLLAADGVASGAMTVGKFVLVNTYLMQLYQPLNFLGFVYREIRQGLVDMEQMFRLLDTDAEVTDRPDAVTLASHLADRQAGEVVF
ncbi:MAG: metal ABC transporter permease, partial [Acidisphaera sp.]|nr:metal ABC transporter permease [Acidisphaera sp.]